jgi:hypothetical protein
LASTKPLPARDGPLSSERLRLQVEVLLDLNAVAEDLLGLRQARRVLVRGL